MRNVIKALVIMTALLVAVPSMAAKKEKKVVDWKDGKMPELTDIEAIDRYLLTCDTLIQDLKVLEETLVWYTVEKVQVTEKDGSISETYHVVDQNGNLRGKDSALKQTIDVIGTCTLLPLKAANISMMSAAYTAALPQLKLKALSYAKYSKLGAQLAGKCTTEVVDILKRLRQQGKEIRALKKMTNEKGELKNPNVDLKNVDGVDFSEVESVQKSSEELAAELAKAQKEDANVGDIDDSALDLD